MALDFRTNTVESKREPTRFGRMLERLVFRVRDEALVPKGYWQVPLTSGQPVWVGDVCNQNTGEQAFPMDANVIVVNVEGGSLRYCDSGQASGTFGELWPAGSGIVRTLKDLRGISLCSNAAGVVANISVYSSRMV